MTSFHNNNNNYKNKRNPAVVGSSSSVSMENSAAWFHQLSIELQVRTFGAIRTLQQRAFDQQANKIAIQQQQQQHEQQEQQNQARNHVPTTTTDRHDPSKSSITPFQIRALFHLWNHALASGDAVTLSSRYDVHAATFIPHDDTMGFPLMTSQQDIQDYYSTK
jgi:hypothetical protein